MLLGRLFIAFQLLRHHGLAHPLSVAAKPLPKRSVSAADTVKFIDEPGIVFEQGIHENEIEDSIGAGRFEKQDQPTGQAIIDQSSIVHQPSLGSGKSIKSVLKKAQVIEREPNSERPRIIRAALDLIEKFRPQRKIKKKKVPRTKFNPVVSKPVPKKKVSWNQFNPPALEPEEVRNFQGNSPPKFIKCYINNQWKWRHYLDVRHKDPEYIRVNTAEVGKVAGHKNSNSDIIEEYTQIFKEPPEMEIMHNNRIISVPADFSYPPEDIIYPPQMGEFTEHLPLSPLVRLSNAASFLFGFMVPKIDWRLRMKEGHWLRKSNMGLTENESEEQSNLERKRKFIETEGREGSLDGIETLKDSATNQRYKLGGIAKDLSEESSSSQSTIRRKLTHDKSQGEVFNYIYK
ncbi:hypothetical protein PGT21_006596 [Puccinia graminis f. sp. tritici]|uniref:Uncharacterized protein n=1 Tax=Puccinia graminis f. sp. tritici TaxID=56615 RepID=A0A5B0Q5Q2_PUCGR|nr:hypothetical protein PGT21_006596 [Puccinia graminis f. sp. tritici]